MAYEIIFKCNSTNNKNVRDGELKILRKVKNRLYFEFGESEMNIKKRFYNDSKTLDEDFSKLKKIKEDLETQRKEIQEKKVQENNEKINDKKINDKEISDEEMKKTDEFIESYFKDVDFNNINYKITRRRKK